MSDDNQPFHDFSRLDDWIRAKRDQDAMRARATLNLSRGEMARGFARPMLMGAIGAGLVVACVWVALPKFSVREVQTDHVVQRDVTVDHVVPRDVPLDIPIPRFVPPAPETSAVTPRTPEERRFEGGEEWRDALVRGRIVRAKANGFVLSTEAGEVEFFPARLGPNGPEPNPGMRDDVHALIGLLGLCRRNPASLYECIAVRGDGSETVIQQIPIGGGKPTIAPLEALTHPAEAIEVSR